MKIREDDPLLSTLGPTATVRADRVRYATGELLGADDFSAEQTYHRRQLARALLLLHGSGSVVGLRVDATAQVDRTEPTRLEDVVLTVNPGLAIDRVGRIIELVRPHSLRLRRWYRFLAEPTPVTGDGIPGSNQARLLRAFHPQGQNGPGAIVADVFVSFHECLRAPSPSFATGPFDALDASQPSRTRDAFELELVLREEPDGAVQEVPFRPVTGDPWAGPLAAAAADPANNSAIRQLRVASLNAWDGLQVPGMPSNAASGEYPAGYDPTAVLLARVRLPAALAAPATPGAAQVPSADFSAAAWADPSARINNFVRNFIIPPAAALRAGLAINP